MINTAPVYGDITQLAATSIMVRFKEPKLQDQWHRVSDTMGSSLMLVNCNPADGMYTITYVNGDGIVLKRISYAREAIIEATLMESVCRIVPSSKTPSPLKAV